MRTGGRCGDGAKVATEDLRSADKTLHLFRYCACMAVAMRERWTDERLDDLNGKVDDGFRRMDERFAAVDARFAQVDARLDAMQRTMTQGFLALFGTQITLFLGTLGFIAVH